MKKLLLAVSLLLGVNFASAQPAPAKAPVTPWRYDIFPLNYEVRYERDASQQLVDRRLMNFAFGVRKGPSTVLFEYSRFNEESGNATLSLERRHEEYLFWWKQNILNFDYFDLFIAGAAGGYSEKVTTVLAGSGSTEDSSGLQIMGGGSAGIQTMLFKMVLVSFEGRLMAGKNLDPNPQPGMAFRLGVEF